MYSKFALSCNKIIIRLFYYFKNNKYSCGVDDFDKKNNRILNTVYENTIGIDGIGFHSYYLRRLTQYESVH